MFCNQTSKIAFNAHRFKPAWATEQLSIQAAWAEIPHASEQTAQKILLQSAPLGITFPPSSPAHPPSQNTPLSCAPFGLRRSRSNCYMWSRKKGHACIREIILGIPEIPLLPSFRLSGFSGNVGALQYHLQRNGTDVTVTNGSRKIH